MPVSCTGSCRLQTETVLPQMRDWKKNLPLAIIEAKDNKHSIGSGMQQARH